VSDASEQQYDYKYSDRDVREDPRLRELAISYINQYGGNFEPLLRAKMAMASGHELNVPQVRMVLNCMRHDAQVSDTLPKPRFPFVVPKGGGGGKVIDLIPRQRRRDSMEVVRRQCSNTEPHEAHRIVEDDNGFGEPYNAVCDGIPFPINRKAVLKRIEAKVKAPFAAGKTGGLVHKTAGYGYTDWMPNRHDWGYRHQIFKVKLVCKNPGWLTWPVLYMEEPAHLYHLSEFPRDRCPRCFTVEELATPLPKPRVDLTPVFISPET